jgi:transcriptional regulator with XRE-family HTH domain
MVFLLVLEFDLYTIAPIFGEAPMQDVMEPETARPEPVTEPQRQLVAFGEWLRAAREEAGLSELQLARRSQLSLVTLTSFEQAGRHNPDTGSWTWPKPRNSALKDLAKGLGVDEAEVFSRLGRPVPVVELAPVRPPEPSDDLEIEAMRRMVDLLTPLDGPTRGRVLHWAAERFRGLLDD